MNLDPRWVYITICSPGQPPVTVWKLSDYPPTRETAVIPNTTVHGGRLYRAVTSYSRTMPPQTFWREADPITQRRAYA